VKALLSRQAGKHLQLRDHRWVPLAGERLSLRGVEAHGQIEGPCRGRQPVGFLVLTRAFVLEVNIERAVGVALPRRNGDLPVAAWRDQLRRL
jgi:hypothetical protein